MKEEDSSCHEIRNFGELLRHELNNPLTGILGNAELLLVEMKRQQIVLPEPARSRLETIAALAMRMPLADEKLPPLAVMTSVKDVTPKDMLRSRVFWLMFFMMTMMSTGGLMIISQFAAFSRDFGVAKVMVFGLSALPFALTFDRITNGLTRPFFGWGEIFSLFPSTLTDTFGNKFATTNYGFLYMAQGVGSVLGGPLAALLHDVAGSWMPVFAIIVTLDALTGILALVALKPLRKNFAAK